MIEDETSFGNTSKSDMMVEIHIPRCDINKKFFRNSIKSLKNAWWSTYKGYS